MGTICPYCNIEVDESGIELEDGCCPECGSVITMSSFNDNDADDDPALFEEDEEEEEDYFDDLEYDDDFEDDDEDEEDY
ncbi:MAG: hypothetical protein PHV59_08440 [Victivallales bacterium]|nr:hypothetical protein [Victivallales bacterium]